MKSSKLYEVKMVDGSQFKGEIAYRDDKMVILKMKNDSVSRKMRLFYNYIISIEELGWQRIRS